MDTNELLDAARRRIEDEYRQRTPQSRALHARAEQVFPAGDTRTGLVFAPHPTYMDRAEGSYLYDVDGHAILDFTCNATSLIHGHAHPAIVAALREQAGRGTAWAAPQTLQLRLAEMLCERVPCFERIRFCNSGTEANMQAIKAARAFSGKDKILKMDGAYHGTYEGTEMDLDRAAGPQAVAAGRAKPVVRGVAHNAAENVLVGIFNDRESAERLIASHRHELAAVVVNPVVTRGGLILPDDGYLALLRDLTRRHDVLLIFDEVITLRVSLGGAQAHYGVVPDLTAVGKIMGGGLPVGAFGGPAEIMSVYAGADAVSHAGTFNGNPLSMAAGIASLDLLTPAAFDRLSALGARLASRFQAVTADLALPFAVNRIASLVSLHLPDQGRPAVAAEIMRLLQLAMLNRGIKCYSLWAISTVNTKAELDAAAGALREALAELRPAILAAFA